MKTPRLALQSLVRCGLWLMLGMGLVFSGNGPHAQTAPAGSAALLSKPIDTEEPADLATDARLDRRVSVHEIGLPLRSLLLKIGQPDLSFAADHNCDTLELHVNLLDRPVRQLMTSLAKLVPGYWSHTADGKGYVLRMNWRAASRRQHWWDLYLGERQRVLQKIPQLAMEAMGAKPEIKGEVTSDDGDIEGFKQFLLAGPTFFTQVPPGLQQQIANNLNETSLLAGIRGTGMNEGALMIPLTDLSTEVQKRLSQGIRQPDRVKQSDCYILFKNDGSGISAEPVDADGTPLGTGLSMDVPLNQAEPALSPHHDGLLREVKRRERLKQDVPPVWKELAAYQQSRVWPNAPPPKGYIPHEDRISDLERMAEADHLEFVSDYYSLPISCSSGPEPRLSPQAREELNRLDTRLNILAADNDVSWKATPENIYLLRNNRWYRDDRLEVPSPLLQRWLEHDARQWVKEPDPGRMEGEALRRFLDWQAEIVSALTPWQLFYGLRYASVPPEKWKDYAWGAERNSLDPNDQSRRYRPFLRLSYGIPENYHLIQFYASLSKEQRTALLAGSLDFITLGGEQQRMAVYLQPLLNALARQEQPIMLGLRHPPGGYLVGGANVRLVIVSPARH
jgi:hypothetical protein